jgi:Bacterial Ig-like domain
MLFTMNFEGRLRAGAAGSIAIIAAMLAGCGESTAPDTTPPAVISTLPSSSASAVLITNPVTVTFSEPMNPITVNATSVALKLASSGALVDGTVTYDAGTNTAKFTPRSTLAYGTSYTIAVTSSASDVAGNGLASPFSTSFTTIQKVADQPYFQGTDAGGRIHFHISFSQSGNTITLGPTCPALPQAWCEIFPLNQAGADAIGPPSPNQNGGSPITSISGTFTDPGITFTFTVANGRTFTFTGTVTNSNTMTGIVSGATLLATPLVLSRELAPEGSYASISYLR